MHSRGCLDPYCISDPSIIPNMREMIQYKGAPFDLTLVYVLSTDWLSIEVRNSYSCRCTNFMIKTKGILTYLNMDATS